MSKTKNILEVRDLLLTYKGRSGLFKRFEYTALNRISFELKRGETLGVLGRNGCGKSTLLRILAGIIKPTSGEIICESSIRRALLTLGLGFRPDLTGRDNALLSAMLQGFSKKQARDALQEIYEFSELGDFFEQPVKYYSSGMRARLSFATALTTDVEILLIDEVLSVGDVHFRHKAEKAMLGKINDNQTVVFVSHNTQQVSKLCDRAIWLENGIIKIQGSVNLVSDKYQYFMQSLDRKDETKPHNLTHAKFPLTKNRGSIKSA